MQIIPELIQSKCNPKNIYNVVDKLLNNKDILDQQVLDFSLEINKFKTDKSSKIASSILINHF